MTFETKDSGARVEFDSGMVRDTDAGKPRYDLMPIGPLRRLAELYARGSVKYGDRNWELADSPAELARFKASAFRHFMDWLDGKTDEDHGVATVFNIFAVLHLEAKVAVPTRAPRDFTINTWHFGEQHVKGDTYTFFDDSVWTHDGEAWIDAQGKRR